MGVYARLCVWVCCGLLVVCLAVSWAADSSPDGPAPPPRATVQVEAPPRMPRATIHNPR